MRGSKFSDADRERILRRFRARPKGMTVIQFSVKERVSVGTLHAWTTKKKAAGKPAKTWFQKRTAKRMKNPRFAAGARVAKSALAKAPARSVRLALPPVPKMSELDALRFENDILRRMVKLARSQGFQSVVDLAWGAPRV